MYNKFEDLKAKTLKEFGLTSSKYLIASLIADIEITMTEDFNIFFKSNEFLTDRQLNIINKYDKDYRKEEIFEKAVDKIIKYYDEIITDVYMEYSKQIDDEFEYNEYKESGQKMELILNYISLNYGFYNELANELDDFGYLRYNSPREIFNTFNLLLYRLSENDMDNKRTEIYNKLVVYGSCFLNELLDLYRYRYFTDKYTFLNYIKDTYTTTI